MDEGGFAGEFLDVVTDFVSDDVGVGEVAAATELAIHLEEEGGVEVNRFFGGEVKGAHAGVGDPASGHAGHAVVVDQFGWAVGLSVLAKHLGPDLFGGAFDGGDEVVDFLFAFGLGFGGSLLGGGLGEGAHDLSGVLFEDKDGDEGHDDRSEATAHGGTSTSTTAATAFDVFAFFEFLPAHGRFLP